ncbi:MAG: PAS domain S-box protein [Polyangiaceae bacterium]
MNQSAGRLLASVLARVAAAPERLAAILEDSPHALVAFTAERTILAANIAGEQYFGYERHELDSQPTDQIVPERFRQPNAPPQQATEDLTTVELPALRKDGAEIPTVWTFGVAPATSGPIFVMIVLDRARLRTELEALQRSDARYKSLLLASASIVWISNAEGEFVEPQPAWEGYTGQGWEEHRGNGWVSAVHPDDRARVRDEWVSVVHAERALYGTHGRIWSSRHNAWRSFQTRAVPVRTSAGQVIEWIGALTDVQDAVEAQENLARRERDLERRFRTIYENALDGIMLMDDELRIVDVNPAACRLLGRGRDQLIGAHSAHLSPPADRAQAPARLGEFRNTGMMTGEGKVLLPDGTIRRAEFGAVANVSPGVHLSVFRDIEDRKRAEEARRFLDEASRILTGSLDYDETLAAVARLAVPEIADWAGVDLLEVDGSFRRVAIAHVDPAKVELANELRRRQPASIHDPSGVGAVVRTGKPELVELVTDDMLVAALAKDPDLLPIVRDLGLVSGITVPLFARGRIIGALSFVSAESRRGYGAADLALTQELSRRATYALENAAFVRDLQVTNRQKDLFLKRAEHLQSTATELVRAESVADIVRTFESIDRASPLEADGCSLLEQTRGGLRMFASTSEFRATAGAWTLSASTPMSVAVRDRVAVWLCDFDELKTYFPSLLGAARGDVTAHASIPLVVGEECVGVFAVTFRHRRAFDAAEREYLTAVANLWGQALYRARHTEGEREAIVRALEAESIVTRKKDEFLAMLGHELRNPLSPIVTATSLIRERGHATTRELEILDRQARHLVRLVDDLLDISRITSGKLSLNQSRVELADIIAQATESTALAFDEKRLRLYSNAGQSCIAVDGDRERLVQVVTNLMMNASKFTPAGKSVFLTAGFEINEAVIEVRDEGEGITPELLPHVFDVFTQGQQGSDRRSGGLGLGLAIARSIVVAHGGRIDAASAGPGQGACFRIHLPLHAPVVAAVRRSVAEDAAGQTYTSSARRVLVVDDNADSAELLAEYLTQIGYDSLVASKPTQALASVRQAVPDAIILDIGLPEMDGYELARTITLELGHRTPKLIALTGYAQSTDRERAIEAGFVEHLAKPVDMKKLANTLRKALSAPSESLGPARGGNAVEGVGQIPS